jgi:molybdate transport repressor ModE-like protein
MNNTNIEPITKVVLSKSDQDQKLFCGPGMINLLEAIRQTGNVRDACKQMAVSYSKAWKLLRGLEAWVDFPITVRQQGGAGGGETHLTEEGLNFLKKHLEFLQDCQNAVEEVYAHYYNEAEQ